MKKQMKRFLRLRKDLLEAVLVCVREDAHHKHYEGQFQLEFPGVFGGFTKISLDCYVIGPSRSYRWEGDTLKECLDKAEPEIRAWIEERKEKSTSLAAR